MIVAVETVTTDSLNEDSRVVVDIETTISGTVSAQIRDMLIAKSLLRNTLLFLKKIGIQNPDEAADLLHSATLNIWDTVDHESDG